MVIIVSKISCKHSIEELKALASHSVPQEIVEDEVSVDEHTYDNDNLEEENENEITKPRASVIRDAIDILAYSMYVA